MKADLSHMNNTATLHVTCGNFRSSIMCTAGVSKTDRSIEGCR